MHPHLYTGCYFRSYVQAVQLAHESWHTLIHGALDRPPVPAALAAWNVNFRKFTFAEEWVKRPVDEEASSLDSLVSSTLTYQLYNCTIFET